MRKIHALLLVLTMAVGLFGFIGSQPVADAKKASTANDLLSLLPSSDAVLYVDAQKVLNDTMPAVLSSRPDLLAKIRKEIDKAKAETGIDPNTIDAAAIGISFKTKSSGENAVVIVRGRFDASKTIDAGFARAEKEGRLKRQDTTYEGRTISLLRKINKTNTGDKSNSNSSDNDTAVTVIDSSTVAVSDVKGIRTVIDAAMGKNRVNDELVALATRNSSALVGVAGNMKALDDLHINLGKSEGLFDGINQFYGSLWASGTDSLEGQLTLRADTSERAGELRDSLNAFKTLFSGFGSKDKNVASLKDVLKGITIEAVGNEVDIKGKVSVSNISLIIDML